MAVAVRTKSPTGVLLMLIIMFLTLLQFGDCSKPFESSHVYSEIHSEVDDSNASSPCELIYQDYLKMIDNFTHCELIYARPFRICISCTEQFEVAKAIYMNLTQEPRHIDCKIKYMQSDRVQVIPTVQANMEDIWNKAHCQNCYSYDPDGLETGKINYRTDVAEFLELYENFSNCINMTEKEGIDDLRAVVGNTSSICRICNNSYASLNAHYNAIYKDDLGDVCMDLMDRMNYTRLLWNFHLKCTRRDVDHNSLPVVIISCVVACTPILFYVSLRLTGKVGGKKLFKQKRLGKNQGISGDATDHSHGAGGDTGARGRRHTTTD